MEIVTVLASWLISTSSLGAGNLKISTLIVRKEDKKGGAYDLHLESSVFCIDAQKSWIMRSKAGTMRLYPHASIDGNSVMRGSASVES